MSGEGNDGTWETVKLGLLFGAWYLANIYFNMYVTIHIAAYVVSVLIYNIVLLPHCVSCAVSTNSFLKFSHTH